MDLKLVSIPGNPAPDDAVVGKIRTPDGVELRFARWGSPADSAGTVCVFSGRGEFIEKYFETIRDLRQRGFAVAMMDWRGQGHSSRQLPDPRKGHVESFSDFEIDVETFMQRVVLPDCPPPYFAVAHSMGGAVLLRSAHAGKRWFERTVVVAPMIDFPPLARLAAAAHSGTGAAPCRFWQQLRSRQQRRSGACIWFCRKSAHLRPRAVCAQCLDPGGRSSACNWFSHSGLAGCRL